MYTKDAILYSLKMADQATQRSLATIEDATLTFPTENGGCHPLWIVGHLAFVEGLTHEMLGGGANPVAHWAEIFGPGTVPAADAALYPAFAQVRDKYVQLRKRNLQLLEAMTEADLPVDINGNPNDNVCLDLSRYDLANVAQGPITVRANKPLPVGSIFLGIAWIPGSGDDATQGSIGTGGR